MKFVDFLKLVGHVEEKLKEGFRVAFQVHRSNGTAHIDYLPDLTEPPVRTEAQARSMAEDLAEHVHKLGQDIRSIFVVDHNLISTQPHDEALQPLPAPEHRSDEEETKQEPKA